MVALRRGLLAVSVLLWAALGSRAFTADEDTTQRHTHSFRLSLEDFIDPSQTAPEDGADDLTRRGVSSRRAPQALEPSGWASSLLTEYGFGPGHEDFEMILDHTKHLVRKHMRGDPDIDQKDRLQLKEGILDNIGSLVKTVEGHMADGKARGSAGLTDEEHITHAGHRLALSLALELKETETPSNGVCESDSDKEEAAVLAQVENNADSEKEAGSTASLAAMDELGELDESGEFDDIGQDETTAARKWIIDIATLGEWQHMYHCHVCDSSALKDRKARKCLEGVGGDDRLVPAVKHFNEHLVSRFQLATACPCQMKNSVQQWRAEMMESNWPRGFKRVNANELDLVCFRASEHLCPKMNSPFQGKKWCSCFHQPLLHEYGADAAWLSRDGLLEAGFDPEEMGCDDFLSNPKPMDPPSVTQPADFWKICRNERCAKGPGASCEGENQRVIEEGLMLVKNKIGEIEPGCRCNMANPPQYTTSVHSSRGVTCFRVVDYENRCPSIGQGGMCLCVTTRAGVIVKKEALPRVSPGFASKLSCGDFFETEDYEGEGVPVMKRLKGEMKAAYGEYKATIRSRTQSLLSAADKVGSLFKFKWSSKLFGFPDFSQSLSLKAICSPVGNCLRYMASFAAQMISFVFSFLADLVRVVLIAIKSLLSVSRAGRAVIDVAGNTFRGGKSLIKSIWQGMKHSEHPEIMLARSGAFNTDKSIFEILNEDDMRRVLSKSLVPGSEAEEASAACSECSAEIEISAGVPLGPIPNPFKLGVDIGFSPQAAPNLKALTLGRMKTCRKCQKASRLFLPPGENSSYAKAYSKSCNPTTVGLCTILATQRQLRIDNADISFRRFRWDGFFFQSSKGGGLTDRRSEMDMDGQRFCKIFENNVFVDLYRASDDGSEVYSDIQCGTPQKTPTPGMRLADVCKTVEEMVENQYGDDSCWFKTKGKPYDYMPQCMELMECSPYNGLDHEAEIMKEANRVALDRIENRFKAILMEAQVHYNKRRETHLDEFRTLMNELSASSEEQFQEGRLRMAKAQVEAIWKHSPLLMFTDYRWARPECLNVRANTDADLQRFIEKSPDYSSPRHAFLEMHRLFIDVKSKFGSPDGDYELASRERPSVTQCPEMSEASIPPDNGAPVFLSYVWCVLQSYRRDAIRSLGPEGKRYVDAEIAREQDGGVRAAELIQHASDLFKQLHE